MSPDTRADEPVGTSCAVLPDTFGPGPLGPVAYLPSNLTLMAPFRTDADMLAGLLPPGLTPTGDDPVVSFRFRSSEGMEWAARTHLVFGVTVDVDVRNREGVTEGGLYYLIGWETDPLAVMLGREVLGTIKLAVDGQFDPDPTGVSRARFHFRGVPLIDVAYRKTVALTTEQLADLDAAVQEIAIIGYKGLPSVDGRSLGAAYVSSVPMTSTIESAWSVDAEVFLAETSVETASWHHRAVAAIRSLPVLDRLPATLVTGPSAVHFGRGRRLN